LRHIAAAILKCLHEHGDFLPEQIENAQRDRARFGEAYWISVDAAMRLALGDGETTQRRCRLLGTTGR
jgi:hypothetical protein